MAKKVQRRRPGAAAAPATGRQASEQATETLDVLHPERTIAIGDRALEVREYGYVEGLKLQAACRAFLDDLYAVFARAEDPPSAEEIAEILGTHILTVQWLIAQAITPLDEDPQAFVTAVTDNLKWIGTLAEDAGDVLTACWWEVNKRFFIRRLQRRALAAGAAARAASPSASSASTPP